MKPRAWTLLDPTTRVADIVPGTVLVFTDTEARLVCLEKTGKQAHSMSVLRGGKVTYLRNLDDRAVVGDFSQQVLGLPNGRCLLLPPLVRRGFPHWVGIVAIMTTVAATVVLAVLLDSPMILVPGLLVALGVLPVLLSTWFNRFEILGQQRRGLPDLASLYRWARALEPDAELEEPQAWPSLSPQQRVQRIREEYGRLRTDLVYWLENPALFDPAVPTTAAFETTLVECQDDPSTQSANRLEVRFNLARQHAERVGVQHVAAEHRAELRKAVKVARLAAGASSGERMAALAQLQRLLDALALYHLPSRTELAAITS